MACLNRPYHFSFLKGFLPQILLGPWSISILLENIPTLANVYELRFVSHKTHFQIGLKNISSPQFQYHKTLLLLYDLYAKVVLLVRHIMKYNIFKTVRTISKFSCTAFLLLHKGNNRFTFLPHIYSHLRARIFLNINTFQKPSFRFEIF